MCKSFSKPQSKMTPSPIILKNWGKGRSRKSLKVESLFRPQPQGSSTLDAGDYPEMEYFY